MRETTQAESAYIVTVEAVWWRRRQPVYVVCGLCCGIPVWKRIHEFEIAYAHRSSMRDNYIYFFIFLQIIINIVMVRSN